VKSRRPEAGKSAKPFGGNTRASSAAAAFRREAEESCGLWKHRQSERIMWVNEHKYRPTRANDRRAGRATNIHVAGLS